ncbi:6260_t:CDS:1 [Dentiscutata erythropus]|uniref:6260_t:CDS:1 n=1 Tax=Dentiscutata erythropus TaxID=1348616 RepID=A0A9N9N180_9GLOM|nr:6260_t:CDS:1 [Dentiscutata erythropus]
MLFSTCTYSCQGHIHNTHNLYTSPIYSQNFNSYALDDIVNNTTTREELNQIKSKIFLPIYDLILPSNKPKHYITPPRSQNGFIIFRRDLHAKMIYERGFNMASQLKSTSRLASILWQELTFDDKEIYLKIADIAKKVHSCIWPNYRYKPYKKDQILLSTFQSAGANLKCQYCVKSSIFQPASFNMIHHISKSVEVSAIPRDYLYSPSKFISPPNLSLGSTMSSLIKQPTPLETRQNATSLHDKHAIEKLNNFCFGFL